MYSQVSYPTPTTAVLTITDAGPLNVLSTPVIHALTKQLGELAVFLCSSAASNVRGVAWNVDGGWTAQ